MKEEFKIAAYIGAMVGICIGVFLLSISGPVMLVILIAKALGVE